jgi:hypothetical protein
MITAVAEATVPTISLIIRQSVWAGCMPMAGPVRAGCSVLAPATLTQTIASHLPLCRRRHDKRGICPTRSPEITND